MDTTEFSADKSQLLFVAPWSKYDLSDDNKFAGEDFFVHVRKPMSQKSLECAESSNLGAKLKREIEGSDS